MGKSKETKLTFLEWYDWQYVDDDDEDMKVNTYKEVIMERYEFCKKDYSEAYYDLAFIFEEYLDYLGKK